MINVKLPSMLGVIKPVEPSGDRYYLYDYGDECVSVTDGWLGTRIYPSITYGTATLTKNSTSMRIYVNCDAVAATARINIQAKKPIDFTSYNKLYVNFNYSIGSSTGNDKLVIGLTETFATSDKDITPDVKLFGKANESFSGIKQVDISSVNKSYYLFILCDGNNAGGTQTVDINQIWLER